MLSFAETNREVLIDFFSVGTSSRRGHIGGGGDVAAWAKTEGIDRLSSLVKDLSADSVTPSIEKGLHTTAFIYPNCVVKTNLYSRYYHDGQCSWLKWCIKHQDNPLVPKISFLLIDEELERFVVVMERLIEHSGFKSVEFRREIDDNVLRPIFQRRGSIPKSRKVISQVEQDSHKAIEELSQDMGNLSDGDEDSHQLFHTARENYRATIEYIKEVRHLCDAITRSQRHHFKRIASKLFADQHHGRMLDVHSMNWMRRPNGDCVLLDPIN